LLEGKPLPACAAAATTATPAALQATSAELGVIIPPSIPMILYGVSAEVSIGELFIAGFGPGIFIGLSLMAFVWAYCKLKGWGKTDGEGRLSFGRATWEAALALLMPVIILGGIYGGVFTPTEAAAVAAFHALVLAAVVYRALTWRTFWGVVLESTRGSAVITMILAGSFILNYAFTAEGVPQAMAQWVDSMQLSQLKFLLLVNVMFLVLGCFLDVSVLLLVFVPMLLPAAKLLGVDLVHFGVLVVLNMMIGLIHPPFGMLLFVTKALTGIPIGEMMKEGWPFLVMLLLLLFAITCFPQIVLWLPQTMGYGTKS
jgi:tripartite ATP-independent transporter DctM subunit